MSIKYALDHRDEKLAEKNFSKIFGFEYDINIFGTKNFIDEFINVIVNTKFDINNIKVYKQR